MAINISFNGATIYKPGAYSEEIIDLSGGFPLSPTGIIALFGEADQGAPGANVPDISQNVYTPDEMPLIIQTYGSGNLVDACNFLFAPAADAAIPSGAQSVYIYKTNASTQATLQLANNYGELQSIQWGTGGNLITYQNTLVSESPASVTGSIITLPLVIATGVNDTIIFAVNGALPVTATIAASSYATIGLLVTAVQTALNSADAGALVVSAGVGNNLVITQAAGVNLQRNGSGRSFELVAAGSDALASLELVAGLYDAAVEPMATLVLNQTQQLIQISQTVGGNVTIALGFTATGLDATVATVTISPTTMTLVVTGGAQAGTNVLQLSAYSAISQLVAAVNLIPGWTASIPNVLYGQLPVSVLDEVTGVGALSVDSTQPARIKKDAYEVQQYFLQSYLVNLLGPDGVGNPTEVGLPDASVAVALTGGELGGTSSASIVNALAAFQAFHVNSVVPLFSRDASADIADGLTDPSSDYMIAAILQAVKTHLSLMATTKARSERQGYVSIKDTYANCTITAQNLADARMQLGIQDVLQNNTEGVLTWFQPWAFSCCMAGARGGAPIGEPLTFKFMNVSGIRQTAQPMTTPDADIVNDFNPNIQYDNAIQNGITFMERPQTGGFRIVVDNTTYGVDDNWVYNRGNVLYAADVLAFDLRNQLEAIYVGVKNTVKAVEVKSTVESILQTYVGQGITVSTSDAPNGYIPGSLVVNINGNTISISVTVKLVEGIDFVLATITLTRASSSA